MNRGELWLRVARSGYPQEDVLGAGDFKTITQPGEARQGFPIRLKAARFFQAHPNKSGKKLYQHGDAEKRAFFTRCRPAGEDDHETVTRLARVWRDGGKPPGPDKKPTTRRKTRREEDAKAPKEDAKAGGDGDAWRKVRPRLSP